MEQARWGGMEFSDKLRHGGSGQPAPVAISPDGLTMATTHDLKVELREVDSLKILQIYTSLDVVQQMVWSPDSKYLACGIYKRGLVQVSGAHTRASHDVSGQHRVDALRRCGAPRNRTGSARLTPGLKEWRTCAGARTAATY